MSARNPYALHHRNNRTVRLEVDRLEGREMPDSFLGELAAVGGFGPLDLRSATATAPFTALPPAPQPKPETPRAADPTAAVVFLPPPAKTTETHQPSPFDALPEFAAFHTFDFGPLVAYNPPTALLPSLPTPSPAHGDTSFEYALPTPHMPVLPDNSVTPLSEPVSPPPPPTSPPPGGSNTPPTASNDSYTIIHDRQLKVTAANGLLANDSDLEGDAMWINIVTRPANGDIDFQTTSAASDGSFIYAPNSEFVGTDTFTYQVFDATGAGNVATVTITVTNVAPTATADTYSTNEDQRLEVTDLGGGGGGGLPVPPGGGGNPTLLANDADADSDMLGTVLVSEPVNGLLAFREDGTFVYTPNPNFSGTDTFQYKATDGIVSTSPATVTITVQPRTGADIDGQDATTNGGWMSEPDEQQYGLGIGVNSPGYVMARAPIAPAGAGWQMVERKLTWDSTTLAVGGVTTPGYLDLPFSGDQVRTVAAVYAGYGGSSISYLERWQNSMTGLGRSAILLLQVVQKKSPLVSVKFTSSDHSTLYQNSPYTMKVGDKVTKVAINAGNQYGNKPHWDRASTEMIPLSHTRYNVTGGPASKFKLTLKFRVADLANKEVTVEGTSTENALNFKSDKIPVPANGDVSVDLTATNKVGEMRVINDLIVWKLTVTGEANPIDMGISGPHKIFVTYGKPQTLTGDEGKNVRPTPERLERALELFTKAFTNAKTAAGTDWPKPQRIVYEAVQLHKFSGTPLKLRPWVEAWTVYDDWKDPAAAGTDCITGAAFVAYAAMVVGMPGTIAAKKYAPESDTAQGVIKAWEYDAKHPSRYRTVMVDNKMQHQLLGLSEDGSYNAFEGTVVYTWNGESFYFPVGPNLGLRLGKANDVLRYFTQAAWFTNDNNFTFKEGILPKYQRLGAADQVDID
jgi:hypothetical protein